MHKTMISVVSVFLLPPLLLLPGTANALSQQPRLLPAETTTKQQQQQSRRSFLASSAAAASSSCLSVAAFPAGAAAAAAGGSGVVPSVSEGMSAFAANRVEESVDVYDAIIRVDPKRKPFLWQRGLALYYAERYQDGADQFETDVAVNPNDTEEQIWHLLCLARTTEGGLGKARERKLTVGQDRRPVMRLVQKLFLGGDDKSEQDLIAAAERSADAGNRFYASLYLSLYYESLNDERSSKQWMANAVGTEYARVVGSRDPMVDVAKVAMKRRGW